MPLPPSSDAFFGREPELARLQRWIDAPSDRVTTVWGPGGVGKTRLVLEALSAAIARGAVESSTLLFCRLESATRPSDVFRAVLQEAELDLLPGQRDTAAGVARRLESWAGSLIVLDAAEAQPAAVSELVAAVLASSERVRFLVTSQVVLDLHHGEVLALGALAPPAPARELFIDRARRVRPTYSATATEFTAIDGLIERLEGNPLAIELAAARAGVLDASAIAARVDESLESLTTSAADVPARQRSIRAVLDWTWDHLPVDVQRILARASVLCGRFDLEAARVVTDVPEAEVAAALETARCFALTSATDDEGLGVRFEVRALVREHARAKLEASEAREAWRRCAAHYWGRFDRMFRAYTHTGDPRVRRMMDAENANAGGLLQWASQCGDDTLAAGSAFIVCGPLFWRGMLRDVLELSERALNDHPGMTELLAIGLELRRCTALLALDPMRVDLEQLEELAARAAAIDEPMARAYALRYLATAARHQGDIARARSADERSLETSQQCGSRVRLKALHSAASTALRLGDHGAAAEVIDEAMYLAREIGDEDDLAAGILLLGELAVAQRDFVHAEKLLGRVLEMCARRGRWQHPREHETRLLLGCVKRARGDQHGARADLAATLDRARLEARVWLRGRSALALASLEHADGHLTEAAALLDEARSLLDDRAPPAERAAFWAQRAALSADLGRLERARSDLGRATPLASDAVSRQLVDVARAHLELAGCATTDDPAAALAQAETAHDLAARIATDATDLRVILALAALTARCDRDQPRSDGYEYDLERRVLFLPGGDVAELGRRGPARRILEGLLARHPNGAPLDVDAAFAIGWPDQDIAPDAAANRVYNTISTLRGLGLGDALEGTSDGYRLRPGDRWSIVGQPAAKLAGGPSTRQRAPTQH